MQVRIKNVNIDKFYVFSINEVNNIEDFIKTLNEICIENEFDFRIKAF